jgi:hypothetical protein
MNNMLTGTEKLAISFDNGETCVKFPTSWTPLWVLEQYEVDLEAIRVDMCCTPHRLRHLIDIHSQQCLLSETFSLLVLDFRALIPPTYK